MRAYRGLRTARYTYVRDTAAHGCSTTTKPTPTRCATWLIVPSTGACRSGWNAQLAERLAQMGDEFREGRYYLEQRGQGGQRPPVRPHGLTHYYEVNCRIRRVWRSPWE